MKQHLKPSYAFQWISQSVLLDLKAIFYITHNIYKNRSSITKAGSHTTVKGIKKPSQALQMSDKAYGTEYVPKALSEQYTLTNLAVKTQPSLDPEG